MADCGLCRAEIEDDEVECCEECGADGICNDCLMDHDCEQESSQWP